MDTQEDYAAKAVDRGKNRHAAQMRACAPHAPEEKRRARYAPSAAAEAVALSMRLCALPMAQPIRRHAAWEAYYRHGSDVFLQGALMTSHGLIAGRESLG